MLTVVGEGTTTKPIDFLVQKVRRKNKNGDMMEPFQADTYTSSWPLGSFDFDVLLQDPGIFPDDVTMHHHRDERDASLINHIFSHNEHAT